MKFEVVASEEFTQRATEFLAERIRNRDKGKPFHIFLSGGSTPKPIYSALGAAGLDWSEVHLWWGDERYVPLDHPDSNYRMVKEALLDAIKLPTSQIHPWPILAYPELAGETYDREFRSFFEKGEHSVDLQILGMGDDGHTASLFPGSPALEETETMCVWNLVPAAQEKNRLTLTFPALVLSREVVFLVKGENKAEPLREVIEEGRHPASRVQGQESTVFFLDQAAAAKLSKVLE